MRLLLQHPQLLGLLALAGLPALVHLLSRARPPAYRFSNLDFLRRVLRLTTRLRRPRDRFLLALRTLAVLALAAAFVSPVLLSRSAALPGEKSTVVVLVDRSASMAARDGVGTRFDAACAEAAAYLGKSRPDAANIVWIDARPAAVFPEPGPNLGFLTESLERATPRPEAGALAAAFDLALRQLAAAKGHLELVVLSDFQAAAWRDFAPALPSDIVVRTRRFANNPAPNATVARLIPQPAEPVAGQDLTLLAQVRNFSPEPVRSRLTLDADGARQSQPVELPPWGSAERAFVLRPAKAGPLPVTASLEADAFPADDSRHAVVPVRDSLRIRVEAPAEAPESRLIAKLAAALGWLEAAGPAADSGGADFRFLTNWAGDEAAALRRSAAGGVTTIVRPAASCPLAAVRALLALPAAPAAAPLALDSSPAGWTVVPAEDHPANGLFRSGDFGNPYAGRFRERLKLPATLAAQAPLRPLALYSDGVPALLEAPTEGAPVLLCNLPLDPAKTDWPAQGAFVPAFAELLLHSRPRATAEPAYTLAGDPLAWTSPDPAHAGAVKLTDAAGQTLATSESTTPTGIAWQAADPSVPGIFRWQISGQPVAFTAVNFPESESDLRPLDAAPAFAGSGTGSASLARQAALAQGLPLWPWLAAAALLFLAAESLLHLRQTPAR